MDQDKWRPITEEKIRDLLEEQLGACPPDRREVFERYRVPPYRAPLIRCGKRELVFVVAVRMEKLSTTKMWRKGSIDRLCQSRARFSSTGVIKTIFRTLFTHGCPV